MNTFLVFPSNNSSFFLLVQLEWDGVYITQGQGPSLLDSNARDTCLSNLTGQSSLAGNE